ncbi:helicase-associated domain-containing protein [Isoptericola sp. 4D.3]|uniref:Helicase-associated domain-containing protein n=1 Tax=Isoptericola peretonis TaxID=2918523 RepID=A0ABT0J5A8_9MICO|nr:helicase-associated domain-containing protein [Isoptericola sp. 4D.3]
MANTSPRGTAEADVADGAGGTGAPHTFTESIRARDDAALLALLRARPDLATPSPSTLRSLAARASSRTALERALAHADARTLQVLEAVVALAGNGPVSPDDVRHAVGADDVPAADGGAPDAGSLVERVLDDALAAALLWDAGAPGRPDLRPAPGLDDVLGPHPAGLGPSRPAERPLTSGEEVRGTLANLPRGGREVLDALAWGPPIGLVPAPGTTARDAVDALVDARLLLRTDARHVALPRDVGLALRGGRTHRSAEVAPPRPEGRAVPQEAADAEAASAALELVRRVDLLVAAWDDTAPPVLRSGGLGVRDLRRTAQALGSDEADAAFVVELAAAAGVVADDGDAPPSYRPTTVADAWEAMDDADRWALLASAWAGSRRTPWLVGSRDEKGNLRAPLSGDLHRGWVPRLRRHVLQVLAAQPGTALDVAAVMAVLRWHAPRTVPPEQAVEGLLAEAGLLGVTGAGALSAPGTAVLAHLSDAGPAGLAEAMRAALPPEVDEVLLQGDLTGIVPGRPSQALATLLDRSADVESRGAATTVRFSPASVTRALDHGTTADELLDALAQRSRVPVPQPLEYLVRDTARRHESLRVGSAGSYVRAADPTVLAGLAVDPRLAHLGLVRLAPTVLAASVPAAELHAALRERGLLSAVEGPDGRVLSTRMRRPPRLDRAGRDARRRPAAEPEPTTDDARAHLVARLRAADAGDETAVDRLAGAHRARPSSGTNGTGTNGAGTTRANGSRGTTTPGRALTPEPGDALATLHDALRDGRLVWIEMVGASGTLERRALKPLRLDGGRLRALDPAREAELTVAVHRIASVEPADG